MACGRRESRPQSRIGHSTSARGADRTHYDPPVTSAAQLACETIARWPAQRPLVALVSADAHGPWSRHSLFAEPKETRVIRMSPGIGDARRAVELELRSAMRRLPTLAPSAHAGWFVSLSYDLGRCFEPTACAGPRAHGAVDDRDWPLATLWWCPDVLVLDHARAEWSVVGDPQGVPFDPAALDADRADDPCDVVRFGPLRAETGRAAFERSVDRCVRLIRDGDLFQANIARRLSAEFSGSARSLAARALSESRAWFGSYLEGDGGRAIVSMSPELFLSLDGSTRRVVTRPIKGTRPIDADPRELIDSAKDAAELTMIVDLMRNDLGRVASIGSVRVDAARELETHATVHHGVAQVSATLRDDVDTVDLLRATFPPGSITGAPKVRAMQVIDELEPARRGPYCGATGMLSSDGSLMLNVAIRTIALSGRCDARRHDHLDGVLDYWAGCGIVAESDPSAEWEESVAKTQVLLRAIAERDARRAVATSTEARRRDC